MSNRAVMWLITYATGLLLSFSQPFYGLLTYLFDYYAHPPLRWWGKPLPDLRWSLIAALVVFVAYHVKGRTVLTKTIFRHRQTKWLIGFLLVAVIVTPFGVSVDRSLHYLEKIAKFTVLYLMIVGNVRTQKHFRWFVLAMILGGLLWGINAYDDPSREAGRLQRIGGPDSFNDNSAAIHLLTTLPFIGIFLVMGNYWEKAISILAAPFVLNTIILCNSRGATLAMGVSLVVALMLMKGKRRRQLAAAILVGGMLSVYLVDQTFIERQLTLFKYQEDTSATDRIKLWKGGFRVMWDYPLGAGGGGFDILSASYVPEAVEPHGGKERALHNTYLWVATDWGVLGLICFMGFIGSTLLGLHQIRRATSDPHVQFQAFALEVSLIGFLVGAFFINRPYAEILYWLAGLTAALRNIDDAETKNLDPAIV